MRDTLRSEFAYQLFALLFAALFVHAIYVTAIRPEAETLLAEQRTAAAGRKLRPGASSSRRAAGLRAGGLLHSHALGHGHHGLQGPIGLAGTRPP